MKKLRIIILCIILVIIFLSGCMNTTKTPKEAVSDGLIKELQNCDMKYGDSSYKDIRPTNEKYCNQLLSIITELIDQGFFDDSTSNIKTIYETVKRNNSLPNMIMPDDLSYDNIVGDI